MSEPARITTASALLAFRHELLEGGLDHDTIRDLLRDASRMLIDAEGLGVKRVELEAAS